MSRYKNPAIKQLKDQQVRYSPFEVRLQQIDRAENFLTSVKPESTLHYPEVSKAITNYKSELYPDLQISGDELIHDLRCFIEDLSDSLDLKADNSPEEILTVKDVSEKFRVSTKTVDRWRERGLVSRRFLFGNRKRVGFLRSSVDRFVRQHASEVERGRQFRQLDDDERQDIIRRARRLVQNGAGLSEASRRIARKLNRSVETIRYTLKNFDKDHPEIAVFPNPNQPLSESARKEIFQKFQRKVSVDKLAKDYSRTRNSIYRIVNEVRAQRIVDANLDFMDNDEFRVKDAEDEILGPPPEVEKKKSRVKPPPGLPPYLASLYEVPLLTREEEGYYFRKMNYLKFLASGLREKLNPSRPSTKLMDQIDSLIDQFSAVKNFLIRSNLRLVVSIAKKHVTPTSNFFEMVSDGNMSLIRAIEKFDYSKGNKFSTYASWAIMKNYARSIPTEHKRLDRFRTGNEELFQQSTDQRTDQFQQEIDHRKQQSAVMDIIEHLDDREKNIIVQRFGLERGTEPLTLEQVGSRLGVTKERIRQLEARALKKLRKIAVDEKLDIPGIE